MQQLPPAEDILSEVIDGLRASIIVAQQHDVAPDSIAVDPGIGFGKTAEQNWVVMRRLAQLKELGLPILVGTSRKSFIGKLLDVPISERVEGTAATVTAAVLRGADVVRVHDVAAMTRVVRVADHMR